jgi:hypothetical protein
MLASILQRLGLAVDKGIDQIQVGTGYPATSVNDEGMTVNQFPSIILPTPDGVYKWMPFYAPTPGLGRHPDGSEDYAD